MSKINRFYDESKKISEEYENKNKHSHSNILDCLKLKEPDHSSILASILNYYTNGEPENLQYFIKMLEHKCADIKKINQCLKDSEIDTEKCRIDCLITDNKNYAIIIENKIYCAGDQDKQIERYIEYIKKFGINANNIFVIYLTKDGRKKVENYSFTDTAKSDLNYKSDKESGRFIELNYKDDILPWLNEICLEIRNKDHLFIEFIDQYIDELNGEFGLREIDKGEDLMERDKLLNILEIAEKTNAEKVEELAKVKTKIVSMNEVIDETVKSIIKELFDNTFGKTKKFENIILGGKMTANYYQIFIKNIDKNVHFEWVYKDITNIESIEMHLHDETSEKKYKDELLKDKKFKDMFEKSQYNTNEDKEIIIYKKVKFRDNFAEDEYEIINDMAKYIINIFTKIN